MSDFDGLVVRNTFLSFPEEAEDGGDDEDDMREAHSRRPRAVSDLTDTKLPWKVPLSEQADGMYQITRRRLASTAADASPTAVDAELDTVEEEEVDTTTRSRKRGQRSARALGRQGSSSQQRFGVDLGIADMYGASPEMAGAGLLPGFFPGVAPGFGPPPPMMPGYPGPWGYPPNPMMPPWAAQFPYGIPPGYPGPAGMPPPVVPSMAPPKGTGKGSYGPRRSPATRLAQPAGGSSAGGSSAAAKSANATSSKKGNKQPVANSAVGAAPLADDGKPTVGISEPLGEPTTVMLRNIPNRYTAGSLLSLLEESGFKARYDFVYLPMDFQNGVNLGYAFVNLLAHEDAIRFRNVFEGFQDWRFDSAKVSEVSWAHPHQGIEEHVERYRNSPVMHPSMPDEYKPMIFQNGQRVTFPPPTRVIKAPKLRLGRDRPREGSTAD